jgi:serine/threonine protein kinase
MDKLKAFSVGGADFVAKPFEPAEVLARVSHHYKMQRMRQALQSEKELLAKMNAELQVARQETADVFGVMADQMRGKVLDGKYMLEEKIGSGGFAVVYKARHLLLQKHVAVKVLRPANPQRAASRLRRFHQEVTSTSRIRHPNVTMVLDAATSSDGITYLVMELLSGHPLSDELRPKVPLPVARCVQIIYLVCDVLAEAHAVGVLHRDIKPANIFLHHENRQADRSDSRLGRQRHHAG